jgi:hypothetical protein
MHRRNGNVDVWKRLLVLLFMLQVLMLQVLLCIPTAILTPRLGNDFSLNIAENIIPTKMEIFSYMLKFEYP